MQQKPAGQLVGDIRDARTGRPLPARVKVMDGAGTEPGSMLAGVGFWCDGAFSVPVLPGHVAVEVSAGRRRAVDIRQVRVDPGRSVTHRVDLNAPEPLAFEKRGWFGVDLFRPVGTGGRLRADVTLTLMALAARAEGVAFCGAASPWGTAHAADPDVDLDEARKLCEGLSGEDLALAPVGRGSDAPMYGSLIHMGAHYSQRIAPMRWDWHWPNFLAIEEARAQGAVTILVDVAAAHEVDPYSQIVALKPGLAAFYSDAPVALAGVASELPFDVVSGMLPDALALSGSDEDQAVWFRLLMMGYRIPAVHVGKVSFAAGMPPAERTFVKLAPGERPTEETVAAAVRAGRVMGSTGPFVFLTIDGKDPGAVLTADDAAHTLRIEALSSTEKNGAIARLELVRDGETVEDIPGQGQTVMLIEKDIRVSGTSWFIARLRAESGTVAWTSPIYFEGKDRAAPRPVTTRVTGRVTEARFLKEGPPLEATVTAFLQGRAIATAKSDPGTGEYALQAPPAARLDVSAEGYAGASTRVFFHTQAPDEIRAIHVNASGRGAAVLAAAETYERMRLACATAAIDFQLAKAPLKKAPPAGAGSNPAGQ